MPKPSVPWPTATPAEAGLDARVLNEDLVEQLGANKTLAAALVVDGKLVWERYWSGTTPTSRYYAFSIAKAFTLAGVGLLADDRKLQIDAPACTWLPEWAGDERRAITLRHLMTMTSGLKLDYDRFVNSPDATAAALAWPLEAPPGARYCYEQATAHVLSPIVQRITGLSLLEFLQQRVLGPIGAHEIGWATTPKGDCLGYTGILTSARDLCRFGQFLLQRGQWNGRQLISAEFLAQALRHDPLTAAAAADPRDAKHMKPGYGWLLFVNQNRIWAGVPPENFAPLGAYGNMCLIDPARKMVFVRLVTPEGLSDYKPFSNPLEAGATGPALCFRTLFKAFR
ncbi:MAG TPA: serine hydrolase domain-containing protein [Planctomycetota bacterium]|nr:serine hydrolase domain-containing protein [Planctomycetota bacterium]